jgi:hypothetical protein
MLQFLHVVFTDFMKLCSEGSTHCAFSKRDSKRRLHSFLDTFLVTIAKCIPHHLNEEIFQVCEQIMDLYEKLSSSSRKI